MAYLMTWDERQKYYRSGIYSIGIVYNGGDYKLLYIGKSKNMYNRVLQHVRELTKDFSYSRKYQLLHNYWLSAQEDPERRIQFNVVECCDEEDLDRIEQEYITYFQPYLNTVGMTDGKTIDQRIAEDSEISWILDLPGSWFCWED